MAEHSATVTCNHVSIRANKFSGIWDCQSSQAVIEFVRRGIAAKQPLEKICENMMDNCLASNSETGGVGCDNMTMAVVGILHGQSKEEWYEKIAKRVANGDGPCAPPEYGNAPDLYYFSFTNAPATAEFRGPGVHHNNLDDSDSGYDMDMDKRNAASGGKRGRIILLGDGSEVLTGSEDTDMIDNEDEKDDLANQATKAKSTEQSLSHNNTIPEKLTGQLQSAKEALDKQVKGGPQNN